MHLLSGEFAQVATVIEDNLQEREMGLHNPHIAATADLGASALSLNATHYLC